MTTGKEVIELSVVATDKGAAIDALRTQLSASAVLFLGDDVTDENAFAQPARARRRHQDRRRRHPGRASGSPTRSRRSACSALLLETRRRWLFGEHAVPIERHSMLANGSTVALLTPDAKVTWLCHPRRTPPAIFADLLGGARPATSPSPRPRERRSRSASGTGPAR